MSENIKACQAAEKFIQNIKNNEITMDTLPNSYEDYTDNYERADLESYKKYIRTLTYADCIKNREVHYHGN